jgi:hypothetical protein
MVYCFTWFVFSGLTGYERVLEGDRFSGRPEGRGQDLVWLGYFRGLKPAATLEGERRATVVTERRGPVGDAGLVAGPSAARCALCSG